MSAAVRHMSADGATTITQKSWPTIVSDAALEVDNTPLKFALENVGTRVIGLSPFGGFFMTLQQIGLNDGINLIFIAADPNGTLSKPWGAGLDSLATANGSILAVVAAGSGVWGATGIYGVTVAATNGTGETIGSNEQTFNISALTQHATYTWAQTPGATG